MNKIPMPEDFDKKAFELGEKIIHHTIQLLQKSSVEYGYSPFATGVLVQIRSNYFLFTAAHVFRDSYDRGNELFVVTDLGIIPIQGISRDTDLKKDNDTDLGYFRLDEPFAKLLAKSYLFLPASKMGDLVPDIPALQYLIVGYPAENIKIQEKTIITGAQIYLTTPVEQTIYDNANLDATKHYMFEYGQKTTDLLTGAVVPKLPKPNGISGCGVWFVSMSQKKDKIEYDYTLVGIMKGGSVHHLRGTKIGVLVRDLQKLENL